MPHSVSNESMIWLSAPDRNSTVTQPYTISHRDYPTCRARFGTPSNCGGAVGGGHAISARDSDRVIGPAHARTDMEVRIMIGLSTQQSRRGFATMAVRCGIASEETGMWPAVPCQRRG